MSNNTFIDLHEQLNTKGWIPDWEFNEAINLYKYNDCATIAACSGINGDYASDVNDNGAWIYHLGKLANGSDMFFNTPLESFSGDLSSLTNGSNMFLNTPLESFSGDLSSLIDSYQMFHNTPLTSFNSNLSNLTNGYRMFYSTPLTSFSVDLPSLTSGQSMFCTTALTSFNSDLPRLENGYYMFRGSALESFNGDLSNLTNGSFMFSYTYPRTYNIPHYKMVDGVKTLVRTSVTATGLKSFNSNLSSLTNGYQMFGDSSTTCSPLDEESIMNIADTIQNINDLELTGDGAGQLWLGYDKSITDTTNIMRYCDQIADKGWTVYLNGSQYVSTDSGSAALIDDESSTTPIPHYYKPVQVTDEEIGEYVDSNGNFYIIVGGQHVFGDDISTYGMFTSYEHAIEQISLGLGLTPYVKPIEETIEE